MIPLERHGIEAVWNDYLVSAPDPGIRLVRGRLSGTRHGIVPDDLPEVVGRVERVRVFSRELERDPHHARTLSWVAGTVQARDVRESPARFASTGGIGRCDAGVIIDLVVR